MNLFLFTHMHALDKKNRVSVPAPFRGVLATQSFQGIVAFRAVKMPAIDAFGMDRMEKLNAQVDQLDPFCEDRDDFTASVFADAQPLAFDSQGRITIFPSLITHAELDQQVLFVGRGSTFQLWNPDRFFEYQTKARQRIQNKKIAWDKSS